MKIVVLTTKSYHHNFFLDNLKIEDKNLFVFFEEKRAQHKYKTSHILLKEKQNYEKKLFKNKIHKRNFFKKFIFEVNSNYLVKYLNKINPDVIILFGTHILKKKYLIQIKSKILLNLHGGDPEFYRGLDTLLWAIFHKDYSKLYTTLHKVSHKVDAGDIYKKIKIRIDHRTCLKNIGISNTQNCVKLVNSFIFRFMNKKKIIYKKQKKLGRYYSAIPSDLIGICDKNLRSYAKKSF